MKNYLFPILLLFTIVVNSNAQSYNWLWAQKGDGLKAQESVAICSDASGNVYVLGKFEGLPITFGNTTLTNAGEYDVFLVKYDNGGNLLWAKSAGGVQYDLPFGISADVNGNVYIIGYYDSPLMVFDNIALTNAGDRDIFIAKYDDVGNVEWAKSIGGTNSDFGLSISADGYGNVYATGSFNSPTITFDTTTLTNSSGLRNIFIVKYNTSGSILWALKEGDVSGGEGTYICAYENSSVFITGYFAGSLTLGNTTLMTAGSQDIFLAKYDTAGNVIWAKGAGGSNNDGGYHISTDADEDVYVMGAYQSPLISFDTITFSNPGYSDTYLTKYSGDGNILWAKSIGDDANYMFYSMSADATGNVYVTGSFWASQVIFGSDTLTNASVNCNYGCGDILIVKYGEEGNVVWAKTVGGSNGDGANSITADGSGNLYLTGAFDSPTLTFGNITLTNSASGYASCIFTSELGSSKTSIEETMGTDDVTCFPNPTSGHLIISIPILESANSMQLEVFNLLGEKVISEQVAIHNQKVDMDLSNQPKGIYLLQLQAAEKWASMKVFIE